MKKQQVYSYGCLPKKTDLRDYKLCSANVLTNFPDTFQLTDLPKIKNQGQVNSCCAHATSSILEYHAKNRCKLSTNFIYGIQKKLFNQCLMGMYLADACKIALQYGDMTEKDCSGNYEIPKCYSVAELCLDNQEILNKAYKFRIASYYLCNSDNDIKFALMNYGPVLGAIMWRNNFSLSDDAVITFDMNSCGGGHAIMIYGWNKDGWLIQNSWGKEFGNEGRFVLPFSYGLLEARAIIDEDNENEFNNLVLIKPKNNSVFNIFYKIGNFFCNKFKKV